MGASDIAVEWVCLNVEIGGRLTFLILSHTSNLISNPNTQNQATPQGQKIFDKLLKACNEVSWQGESILVLNHIRVDPPYTPEHCTLVDRSGGLDEHSLERVKKIVGVANE